MKVFRGKLESACLSIHVSICPCVSPSVYKILVSVKALGGGIKSHLVTALVSQGFPQLYIFNASKCGIEW